MKKRKSGTNMSREEFVSKVQKDKIGEILEIGPLNRPLLVGQFMYYFDLYPTDELKMRAQDEGLDPNSVPEIDFYDKEGNLANIHKKFGDVISSHCLEHQPDLVKHLKQVSDLLLGAESRYWVILPDKRFCFDALLPESSISEVVQANHEKSVKPSIWKVIEHRALTTHNKSSDHWRGIHGDIHVGLKERWDEAIREFYAANGNYIDVHCWQFTPKSFGNIIRDLNALGLTDFEIEELYDTPFNGIEFCAILKKSNK